MSKYLFYYSWLLYIACSLVACSGNPKMDFVEQQSGRNFVELRKVLAHFSNDSLKLRAARFLIENMGDKFCYEGEILRHYDTYFRTLSDYRTIGVTSENDPRIVAVWDSLVDHYGPIRLSGLERRWDCQTLSADFLIHNIDAAFLAWESAPDYVDRSFETFLEFVLPYRVAYERPVVYRAAYGKQYRLLRDTTSNALDFLKAFSDEFFWRQGYRYSGRM